MDSREELIKKYPLITKEINDLNENDIEQIRKIFHPRNEEERKEVDPIRESFAIGLQVPRRMLFSDERIETRTPEQIVHDDKIWEEGLKRIHG